MNKTIIIAVALVILAGVGGFLGGATYQKSQTASRLVQFGNGQGGQFYRRFGQGANGTNVVRGQVVSTDANSITVKLPDGSTKILIVGSSTAFSKSASGSLSDLKTGDSVMAFGTSNSDGSITAQNVQINPPMPMRGMRSPASPTQGQ